MLEATSKAVKVAQSCLWYENFTGYSFEWLGQPSLDELGDQEDYLVLPVLIHSVLGKSYLRYRFNIFSMWGAFIGKGYFICEYLLVVLIRVTGCLTFNSCCLVCLVG